MITPPDKRVLCGRCGEVANPSDHWEHGWPLCGRIDISCPAQAFAFLAGAQHVADSEHFEARKKGHPACSTDQAQRVVFEWSHNHEWRLCYQCQKHLLRVVGAFFGYGGARDELLREKAACRKTEDRLIRLLVDVLNAYEGQVPCITNQGQALDGYSTLANFVAIAKRARILKETR